MQSKIGMKCTNKGEFLMLNKFFHTGFDGQDDLINLDKILFFETDIDVFGENEDDEEDYQWWVKIHYEGDILHEVPMTESEYKRFLKALNVGS
jgi:hypothetical protein